MQHLQMIYFNDFYNPAKFQKILWVQTDFTDQNRKTRSGLSQKFETLQKCFLPKGQHVGKISLK